MPDIQEFLLSTVVQDVTRFALYALVVPALYIAFAQDMAIRCGRRLTTAAGMLLAGYSVGFAVVWFAQSEHAFTDATTLLCLAMLAALLHVQAARISSVGAQ